MLFSPLLSPIDFNEEFFLYLVAFESTIGMVCVLEDDMHNEHNIYYLRKGLTGPNILYSPIKRLALVVAYDVQWLQHYIILWNSMVIANSNPMKHILRQNFIWEKYLKWIVILKEFDLYFVVAETKKSLEFIELMSNLPWVDEESKAKDYLLEQSLILIRLFDPHYGKALLYLQTQFF